MEVSLIIKTEGVTFNNGNEGNGTLDVKPSEINISTKMTPEEFQAYMSTISETLKALKSL
jgi:hypothetical protein